MKPWRTAAFTRLARRAHSPAVDRRDQRRTQLQAASAAFSGQASAPARNLPAACVDHWVCDRTSIPCRCGKLELRRLHPCVVKASRKARTAIAPAHRRDTEEWSESKGV